MMENPKNNAVSPRLEAFRSAEQEALAALLQGVREIDERRENAVAEAENRSTVELKDLAGATDLGDGTLNDPAFREGVIMEINEILWRIDEILEEKKEGWVDRRVICETNMRRFKTDGSDDHFIAAMCVVARATGQNFVGKIQKMHWDYDFVVNPGSDYAEIAASFHADYSRHIKDSNERISQFFPEEGHP